MAKAWGHSRSGIDGLRPSGQSTGGGQRLQPCFSFGNKKARLVSIHAEPTVVTGVFQVSPVLEGSWRDADPCQRQLLGPPVLVKNVYSSAHLLEAASPACLLHPLPSLNGVVPQQQPARQTQAASAQQKALKPATLSDGVL